MANEEKIREILDRHFGHHVTEGSDEWYTRNYQNRFSDLQEMADWKDKQYSELKELVLSWFNHIEQMSSDRKTANGFVMDYQGCLDEIKVIAKDAQEYLKI